MALRTEGFQAGDLVTLIDRAVSHSELRVLCPAPSLPFADYACQRMSIESGSDLNSSLELSTSPQKPPSFSPLNAIPKHFDLSSSSSPQKPHPFSTPLGSKLDLSASQGDSGISSPMTRVKKTSVISASSLTPTTPRSSERNLERSMEHSFERSTERSSNHSLERLAPFHRVGSLSQMVLTVQDFVTALDGYVPVSLRGLPLHSSGTTNFSHIGGLERAKQVLRETLLWPTKVRMYVHTYVRATLGRLTGSL